jgi:hypothetical protein
MYRAATDLECRDTVHFAETFLTGMFPIDWRAESEVDHTVDNAVDAIILGRTYKLPKIIKRAYYEVVSSGDFGMIPEDSTEGKISVSDMRCLIRAQAELRSRWLVEFGKRLPQVVCEKKGRECAGQEEKQMLFMTKFLDNAWIEHASVNPLAGWHELMNNSRWTNNRIVKDGRA